MAREYSNLPETVQYPDLPETTQHPAYEGLRSGDEGLRSGDEGLRYVQEGLCPVQAEKIAYSTTANEEKHAMDHQRQQREGHQSQAGQETTDGRRSQRRQLLYGLAPWAFWTVLAVVILCIIAAVVGGVAGSLSSNHHSSAERASTATAAAQRSSSSDESSMPSTTPATQTTSSESITTTEIIGPTATLYRDCPSVDNTIYSFGASSAPLLFRQWCSRACFNINGLKAIVNQRVQSLSDCIDLCASYNIANQTDITTGEKAPCNSVCWRNTLATDLPGSCFGFETQNVSGHWNITASSICDSAGWINQNI